MSVSNSSLYVMSFLSSAVKIVFRTQDKLLRESTRVRKGLALVRLFLLLKLFLELGVGLLKIAEIVLEKPCFSCPLLLQLVELSLKIYVQPRFNRIEAGLPRTKASSHHRIARHLLILQPYIHYYKPSSNISNLYKQCSN
jgi:hypothetical protein